MSETAGSRLGRAARLSLFALVASLALAPPTAHAAFPGANGKIAFSNGASAIATVNPDGTGQVQLTTPPCGQPPNFECYGDGGPVWSPNGQRIAFARLFFDEGAETQGSDIYVMNADGSGVTNVTNSEDFFNSDPTWSPDGTTLAFRRGPGLSDIHTIKVDGTGLSQLTHINTAVDPSWSPNGQKVAFSSNGPTGGTTNYDIYVVNADGTGTTDVSNDPEPSDHPSWSPDGRKIAFRKLGACPPECWSVWTMDSNGANQIRLTSVASTQDTYPAWSPDGRRITFSAYRSGTGLYVIDANGSNEARITSGGGPDWQPLPTSSYSHPQTASALNVSLVPAFKQCGTGGNPSNSKHAPPLATNSCNPPQPGSVLAAVGTTSQSSAQMTVTPGDSDPTNGNQANVSITASLTDIQSTAGGDYNPNASGADLTAVTRLRFTDKANGYGGLPATATEYDFKIPIDCSSTPNPSVGSSCSANTTANALIPGLIQEQRLTIVQAFRVREDDSGANGIRGDSDDRIFATQGIFVP
jgi:Tol biopolymer transport system component